ncbi:hypothetical protein IFR05_013964 [Cadophora sp. M221]|nr:hypothetical protein IFR05_013964 [Cadophora sp. M221]
MANSKAERGHFAGARGARMIKEQRGEGLWSCGRGGPGCGGTSDEAKSGPTQAAHSDESLYPGFQGGTEGGSQTLGTAKRSKGLPSVPG